MRAISSLAAGILLCVAPSAFAQSVQVSRQNRTVDVTVTQTISVDAEVADVTIGCVKYGQTHDQAYQENLKSADQILKALLDAHVPKENITSRRIELNEEVSSDPDNGNKGKVTRHFKAHQSWTVRVKAADAQRVVDLAVQAGANGIESVSWDVSNPAELELKARMAALEKAHAMAAEIAKNLGGKLGDPLYSSNEANENTDLTRGRGTFGNLVQMSYISEVPPAFKLQLFPEKVEKEATVRVVFALE